MQHQSHSSSVSLGQNSTPSSIVRHPTLKKFYVTVNPAGKTLGSHLSIVEYNDSEDRVKLSHNSTANLPNNLVKCAFYNQQTLFTVANNTSNHTILSKLAEPALQLEPVTTIEQSVKQYPVHNIAYRLTKQIFYGRVETAQTSLIWQSNRAPKQLLPEGFGVDLMEAAGKQQLLFCANNNQKKLRIFSRKNTKDNKTDLTIQNIHNSKALSIELNMSKQQYFMVAFEDCLKFWDIKKPNIPLKSVDNHHTLLLNAKYNTYDQLVLTSYDDGTVGLFRMTSISSGASTLTAIRQQDGLVKLYDQHEDSVYHICWSNSPWYFSSVSYNANLILNSVPSAQKHRILF